MEIDTNKFDNPMIDHRLEQALADKDCYYKAAIYYLSLIVKNSMDYIDKSDMIQKAKRVTNPELWEQQLQEAEQIHAYEYAVKRMTNMSNDMINADLDDTSAIVLVDKPKSAKKKTKKEKELEEAYQNGYTAAFESFMKNSV